MLLKQYSNNKKMKNRNLIYTLLILTIFMGQKVKGQDWPNLNRYRNDNEKIAQPTAGENRIVFMGNSITEGWGNIVPSFFAGKPYINRGISGQTTPQMLLRFRADVIQLKPKVVVILAGTNDIAGNTGPSTLEMIEDNIFSMAELATANGIKVVLCSVLPVYDYPWKPGLNPSEKIIALNKSLQNYAAKNKLVYLDYHTPMKDDRNGLKAEYSGDGVHPNELGYQVMAPLAEKAIAKALGKK
jgi:lysophospholipase L1-like esterase